MKKLLALVLALVMSMSLVTISNAAFKDGDKINADYKEAVDVMNAVGVLVGDENGKFNATANLTREQAAKIIAYLELGEKAADALVGGAIFTDVAATRWSAGFVGYCAQAGVVNGVGNGNFDPAGQLTALQFGKMLLVELGYDAKAEKMVGTDWAINTSKLMAKAGLMDKIEGSVNQVLTREKAAQMCLNAIEAPMVTYDTKGSSISVNGAEINFGASVAKYETSTIAKDQNISRDKLTSGEYTVELGEKLYKDLKKASIQDNLGRPATKWTWKADEIDTYADKADKTYSKNVKLGDIYKDLGMSTADDAVVYIDGIQGTAVKVSKANTVKIASDTANKDQVDTGTTVEVYFEDSTNDVTICVIHNYAGTVEKTVEAKGNQERHIIINDESDEGVNNFKNKFETEDTVADDTVVSFTFSQLTKEIQSVTILESVTGVLTKKTDNTTDGKSVYLDGNEYKVAKGVGYDGFKFGDMNIKSEFTAYLDEYNNVIYVKEQEYVAGDYALILNIEGNSSASFFNNRVKLLTADGLVKTYDTDKDYTKKGASYGIGNIVTYKVDATSKEVTLNATETGTTHQKGLGYAGTDYQFQLKNNDARIKINGTAAAAYANSKTVFVVYDGDDYKAYTGIKSAPSIEATATAAVGFKGYCRTDNLLTVAFVDASAAGVKFDNKDVIYLAGASKSNRITDGDDVYYTYNAVVNGKITETPVKVAATGVNYGVGVADGSASTNYIFNGYNDNKYDVIGTFIGFTGDLQAATVKGTVKLSGEYTIGFGTNKDNPAQRWTVNEKANIYKIDADGVITEVELKSITTDANDQVIYTYEDGQITNLFVQEIDDKVTDTSDYMGGEYKLPDYTDLFVNDTLPVSGVNGTYDAATGKVYIQFSGTVTGSMSNADFTVRVRDNRGKAVTETWEKVKINKDGLSQVMELDFKASVNANEIFIAAPTSTTVNEWYVNYSGSTENAVKAGATETVANKTGTEIKFTVNAPAGATEWKFNVDSLTGGTATVTKKSGVISDVTGTDKTNLTSASEDIVVEVIAGKAPVVKVTTAATKYNVTTVLADNLKNPSGAVLKIASNAVQETAAGSNPANDVELTAVITEAAGTALTATVKFKVNDGAEQTATSTGTITATGYATTGLKIGKSEIGAINAETTVTITEIELKTNITSGGTITVGSGVTTATGLTAATYTLKHADGTAISPSAPAIVGETLKVAVESTGLVDGKTVTYTLNGTKLGDVTGTATSAATPITSDFAYVVKAADTALSVTVA